MKNLTLKIKMLFSVLTTWFAKVLKENDNIVKVIAPFGVNVCNFIKEYNGSSLVSELETWAATLGGPWAKVAVGFINSFLTDNTMDSCFSIFSFSKYSVLYSDAETPFILILLELSCNMLIVFASSSFFLSITLVSLYLLQE